MEMKMIDNDDYRFSNMMDDYLNLSTVISTTYLYVLWMKKLSREYTYCHEEANRALKVCFRRILNEKKCEGGLVLSNYARNAIELNKKCTSTK